MNNSSGDLGLGIPFNWFQYKVLQMMIANVTGYKSGRLVHQIGNLHYYDRHEGVMLKQLFLPEFGQPLVLVNKDIKDFYNYSHKDVYVEGYKHGEYIPLEVAI